MLCEKFEKIWNITLIFSGYLFIYRLERLVVDLRVQTTYLSSFIYMCKEKLIFNYEM